MVKIPFEVLEMEDEGCHLIIKAEIFDQLFKLVVDTGASKTVLDRTTLAHAGIEESLFEESQILSSGLGTNDMQSFFTTIPSVKIGNWQIENFKTAVLDLSTINYAYQQMGIDPVVGVLGGDILNSYRALINYKNNTLTLNERKYKKKKH